MKTKKQYERTKEWIICDSCRGSGGPDDCVPNRWNPECPCTPCCYCGGKKGRWDRTARQIYKCIGGPLDGQTSTEEKADEYFPYNSSRGRVGNIPSVVLIHKSLL